MTGRRWFLVALVVWFAGVASAQLEMEPQVFAIAAKLRCPVCTSESVAQSSSETSVRMREIIAEKLQEGEREAEILAFFQARYGDWILLEPPRRGLYLIVWILPIAAVVLLLGFLAFFLRRWTRRGQTSIEANPRYLDRVRRDMTSSAPKGDEPR